MGDKVDAKFIAIFGHVDASSPESVHLLSDAGERILIDSSKYWSKLRDLDGVQIIASGKIFHQDDSRVLTLEHFEVLSQPKKSA